MGFVDGRRGETPMTLLHFVNCSALTYVPLYIVYVSTSMRDGGKVKELFHVAAACTAAQFLQMVLVATFIQNTAPLWMGASGNEFDWKYIQIAIEGNLALVTYMAFARLLSRYNARDADSTTQITVTLLALMHSITGSSVLFSPEFLSPLVVLGLRAVWVAFLWMTASYFFISRNVISGKRN